MELGESCEASASPPAATDAEHGCRDCSKAADEASANSSARDVCLKRCRNGAPSELANTAFRLAEKRYKLYQLSRRESRRVAADATPSTDFTDVVRFHCVEANTPANQQLMNRVVVADPDVTCFTFAGVPGLLIFPGVLSEEEQVQACRETVLEFGDSRQHPTILSTHAKEPRETQCYQPPMRWSTLGFSYEWTSKTYDRSKYSTFPTGLKATMERLIGLVARVSQDQWHLPSPETYQPQTAIVNYYPVGSMMMCHQDISEEVMEQPLVSLSLGSSAVFLMGSNCRDDAPFAFELRSGDVAAFAGPARTAFHATPRILDDCPPFLTIADEEMTAEEAARFANNAYHQHPTPDGSFVPVDKDAMSEAERERYWRLCMRHMRVNVNARQVYPENCAFLYQ